MLFARYEHEQGLIYYYYVRWKESQFMLLFARYRHDHKLSLLL